MGNMASSKEHCPIDKLTDDALLMIFAHLSLEDKCHAARVCRRFRKLIQDGSLWKYIDVSQVTEGNQSNKIRRFMQRYAGHATRYLRLGLIDHTIVEIVHEKCRRLQQLSFTMEEGDTDLSSLPNEIVCLYMSFVKSAATERSRNEYVRQCLKMFVRQGVKISRFCETLLTPLEYVSIKGALIDDTFCERFARNRTPRQLRLDYSSVVASSEFQESLLGEVEMLELHDCGFITSEAFNTTCEIVGRNRNLKGLELCDPSFSQPVPIGTISLDDLFLAISSHGKLVMLSVDGPCFFTISGKMIVQLLKNVHDLEVLSLVYNQDVKDRVLAAISDETKNLKVLNLHGCRGITDGGICCLRNHPTLMALSIGACLKLNSRAILQTASAIPRLMLLGMSRPREEMSTELVQFESDNPQIHIEFNYDSWLIQVQCITQSLSEYEMKHFIH